MTLPIRSTPVVVATHTVGVPADADAVAADAGVVHERALVAGRRLVAELFGAPAERSFVVRYWSGLIERPGQHDIAGFTLVLTHPGAFRRMLLPPTELTLAEAFIRGDFEIEGDIEAAAALGDQLAERLRSIPRLARIGMLLLQLPMASAVPLKPTQPVVHGSHRMRRLLAGWRHTRARDAEAIRRHYDVGNDFYALWLDGERVYSCGYFPQGEEDLDTAQRAKLEHICRKLRLTPGDRLLDIGCGWGALIRYAARHYGVEAVGITLSEAQAEVARKRIARDGLTERCRVEVRDYRDLSVGGAREFDKVASVGMFEHVGAGNLDVYFETIARITRPGGLVLNHGIVSLDDARGDNSVTDSTLRLWGKGRFIDRYVFPDGELTPLSTAIGAAERAGLETRDVESLREHYATTLRHWVSRLEAQEKRARALVGDATYRVWRLYMSASAHAFATARIGVTQMLFAKPDGRGRCSLPPSRADLYHELHAGLDVSAEAYHDLYRGLSYTSSFASDSTSQRLPSVRVKAAAAAGVYRAGLQPCRAERRLDRRPPARGVVVRFGIRHVLGWRV